MICDDVESELEAWGVGLLDHDERRELETHLAYCQACDAQAASLRRIVGRLSTAPARVDAAGLEERILARALGGPRRPVPRTLAAAAAGLIAALFIPWGSHGPAPRPVLVSVAPAAPASVPEPPRAEVVEEPAAAPEVEFDVPPSAPAEAVASFSWEEAADVPLFGEDVARAAFTLWGVDLEAREEYAPDGRGMEGASLVAGNRAFIGWCRDDEVGGAALAGLCLKF